METALPTSSDAIHRITKKFECLDREIHRRRDQSEAILYCTPYANPANDNSTISNRSQLRTNRPVQQIPRQGGQQAKPARKLRSACLMNEFFDKHSYRYQSTKQDQPPHQNRQQQQLQPQRNLPTKQTNPTTKRRFYPVGLYYSMTYMI